MKKTLLTIGIVLAGVLGWLFIEKPEPPFGGTTEVNLIWDYSYSDINLAEGTYHQQTGFKGQKEYAVQKNGIRSVQKNKPIGLIEVTDPGETAFNVFIDPETDEVIKYQTTKSEYDDIRTRDIRPQKTLTKQISFFDSIMDILGVKKAYAISRHNNTTQVTTATSITKAYDVGTDPNRVLMVAFSTSSATVAATYNGVGMSTYYNTFGVYAIYMNMFYMDDPPTGEHNVYVEATSSYPIFLVVVSYDGADLSTAGQKATDGAANGTPSGHTLTGVTASSYVLDLIGSYNDNLTVNIAQNQYLNVASGGVQVGSSDIQCVAGGNQAMSWDRSGSSNGWDYIMGEIKSAGGGATPKPRRHIIE